jgi:hypothetical protein
VNRRPWLLALPVALNLYLAFGPRLSFTPLLDGLAGLVQRMQPSGADPGMLQDTVGVLEALGQIDMRAQLAALNFIPTLPPVSMQDADAIVISSVGGALAAFVLINALALPLSALFLVLTAQAVRGEALIWASLGRDIGRTAVAILAYIAVIAVVGLALGLPYIFLSGLLMLLSPAIGVLAVVILQLLVFWAWIYIGFTNEAIVMGRQGPLQAIRASFNLVRHNFWGTLGFLALSAFVIPLGLSVVWQMISGSPVGLAIAALGSAYIGCGLAAARMVFYRERIRRWRGAPAYAGTGQ